LPSVLLLACLDDVRGLHTIEICLEECEVSA
jgi:hypothetical protein